MTFFNRQHVQKKTTHRVWLQYQPNGKWVLCYPHPTVCQVMTKTAFTHFDEDYYSQESFTEFSIGPINVQEVSNSYQTSINTDVLISDLWFIEESFDLKMFAGTRFNFVDSKTMHTFIYFQLLANKRLHTIEL